MLDFKKEISKLISKELNMEDDLIYSFIQLTKDETNGDYSFPCFSLAKTLRKSPMMIADELKEKINNTDFIEKIESVSGYLNFYIKKEVLIREVINSFDEEKEKFGSANIGQDKTVLIVAQRISTIMNADKIIVLENGKCVGMGTHKELLKDNHVYREIAYSQLTKEELENE